MMTKLENRIGSFAVKALLYEVSATPKPGLVDRNGSGAHEDMDYYTFLDSTVALVPYFVECAKCGIEDLNDEVMSTLKALGMRAELEMFSATDQVNTHKGLIYALGLNSFAVAAVLRDGYRENFLDLVSKKIISIVHHSSKNSVFELETAQTYGGKQYRKHGLLGARGESISGYLTSRTIGLTALKEGIDSIHLNFNDSMLYALLRLICVVDDSNVIGRHGLNKLLESRVMATDIIESGHLSTEEGRKKYFEYLSWSKINKVSHGGAADLLAVSVFYYFIEQHFKQWP